MQNRRYLFLTWAWGCMSAPLLAITPVPDFDAGKGLPVHEHDSWTYRSTVERAPNFWHQTHDEVTVVHVLEDGISVSSHEVGSTGTPAERMVGRDWSRFRSIDGKEVVVNRPLAFPLDPGKSWDIQYTDTAPANRNHRNETIVEHYRVVGFEDVDVPAGHFHALKIECEGHWTAEIATGSSAGAAVHSDSHGSTTQTITTAPSHGFVEGRLYKTFWYVPQVRRWVKSVEEYYDPNGFRNERFTSELDSWHLTDESSAGAERRMALPPR